jgi:hypothetical protein
MGSGKYIKYAINKHGIDNFRKEILFVFDNPTDMYNKEADLVNEEFIAEANTYNLKVGGFGGFDYINNNGKNLYGKNGTVGCGLENLLKVQQRRRTDVAYKRRISQKVSETLKQGYVTGRLTPTYGFKNKSHKDSTKQLIGANSSKHQAGTGNSQFGTMWITDGTINKKIKKILPIPTGFRKGRITK